MATKQKQIIGRVENILLPELETVVVPARIDTGAKTTSVWASVIKEHNGILSYVLFAPSSALYSGTVHKTKQYAKTMVASSIGTSQERYKVRILIRLNGRNIRAHVTLADRSEQAYPVLIGRNVLRGKFMVDVEQGNPHYERERARTQTLRTKLEPNTKETK